MANEILLYSDADIGKWINIHHRMLCSDIEHINELYARIDWLSKPWYKRAFRRPPWLTRSMTISATSSSAPAP